MSTLPLSLKPATESGLLPRTLGVLGVSAIAGVLVALVLPRGPTTALQALVVLIAGLGIGVTTGLVLRSRWALVFAPLAHILAIELTRLDAVGPTVDAVRFDSAFGLLALLLGRGFHFLVGLLPMIIGAGFGAAWAHRKVRPIGRLSTASGAVIVLALAGLIAWPASTPPILGADGQPVVGSIAELATVRLGGQEQAILIRGYSADNPVLLYLSGGPGQSDLMFSRVYFDELAKNFVVVGWDQRGTGKSYAALDPTGTLTLDQAVADTIELTDYLRTRFGEQKIYLLGESWGSTLGVLAVQQRPDLYYAFIGSGQMVSQRETDRRLYHDLLAYAAQSGDAALAERMRAYGEPPYADTPYANGTVMGFYDVLAGPYTPPAAYVARGEAAGFGPYGVLGSEYNFVEKANVLRGLLDMFTVMYPQLQHIDFRQDVTRLEVPVYVLDAGHELAARRDLAREWFEGLQAPSKQFLTYENAGHSVAFEQFEAVAQLLTETVLPATYPSR